MFEASPFGSFRTVHHISYTIYLHIIYIYDICIHTYVSIYICIYIFILLDLDVYIMYPYIHTIFMVAIYKGIVVG